MKSSAVAAIIIVLAVGGFVLFRSGPIRESNVEKNREGKINQILEKMSDNTEVEEAEIINGPLVAAFETNLGTFTVRLYHGEAPNTVANFVKLARAGFYDGLSFHRVIDGFMIQGGDPNCGSWGSVDGRLVPTPGTPVGPCGAGGPGYTILDEISPRRKHDRAGIISMANAGPNTGGSQFFITLAPTPWLDGKHAVFGEVTAGLAVVEEIGRTAVGANDRPTAPVVIKKVQIQTASEN